MKLKKFLTEQNYIIDFILSTLEDDCIKFIKELKGNFIYRGTRQSVGDIKTVKSRVETGRRPKDTDYYVHNEFNDEFYREFGWKVRDGIFTSFKISMATGYGTPYLFYPIGKYEYCYTDRYEDLYSDYIQKMDGDKESYDEASNSYYEQYSPGGYGEWVTRGGKGFRDFYDIINEYNLNDYMTNATSMLRDNEEGNMSDGITTYFEVTEDMINDGVVDPNEYDVSDVVYFEWEPSVSYDDFVNDYVSERTVDSISDVVKTYKDKNILSIKNYPHEISFNCKEYYLVNVKYEDEIKNYFKNKIG